jgi:O-6-methylguanine DNA methyltransferase
MSNGTPRRKASVAVRAGARLDRSSSSKVEERFLLVETPRGACGIAWLPTGITRVQLPEASESATLQRLLAARPAATPGEPGGFALEAATKIAGHLGGAPQDFSSIPLEVSLLTEFRRRVYAALQQVPPGETTHYAALATLAGYSAQAGRAVGQAMATNPFPVIVPCHRVLAAGRRIGGFSAHGGAQTKVDLLALEGVWLDALSLGLDFDPRRAAEALSQADPLMGELIRRAGPLRLLVDPLESPFEALIKAILYQQLTAKAAKTIQRRLEGIFWDELPLPEMLAETPDDALRSIGLSRNKALALKDLAVKTLDGTVPSLAALRRMEDEAIVERLTTVRGIGRWTVEMLLIFRLGRGDIFPVDDYGMRKGLAFLSGEGEALKPKDARPFGERWRPYRSLASWYLWRASELGQAAFAQPPL